MTGLVGLLLIPIFMLIFGPDYGAVISGIVCFLLLLAFDYPAKR